MSTETEFTLGTLLKDARKGKRLTLHQLLESLGITCTVTALSQWENNTRVPSPEQLEALCSALELDLERAFYLWAQSQMPNRRLKALFKKGTRAGDVNQGSALQYPAAQTLTLQKRDAPYFNGTPEALTILTRALMAGLQEKFMSQSHLTTGLALSGTEANTVLNELESLGYLIRKGGKFRTPVGIKYIYRPETPEFAPLKAARLRFLLDLVLKNLSSKQSRKGLTTIYGTTLNPAQIDYFISSLEGVVNELVQCESPPSDGEAYYLVIAFGPESEKTK